jgi:hypothetical protein
MDCKDITELHQTQGSTGLVNFVERSSRQVETASLLQEPLSEQALLQEPLSEQPKVRDDRPPLVIAAYASSLPAIISSRDLVTRFIERPPVLIDGLLHQGSKMVLGGGSKSFKTWCLMDLAMSVATGAPWWGQKTLQGHVLYINLELPDVFFRDRLMDIQRARGHSDDVWDHLDVMNLRGHCADFTTLRQHITNAAGNRYVLIIIDPVYKVLGNRDENSAGNIAELLNEFEKVAVQNNAAVVYGHHFSKGNQSRKESIDRMSGSGVFARDADSLLVMSKHEQEEVFVIEPILRNFKPVPAFCVKWEHPVMRLEHLADPAQLKHNQPAKPTYSVEQLLKTLGVQSLCRTELETELSKATGMSGRTFDKLFKEAKETGKIAQDPRTKQWSVTTLSDEQ